MAPTTAASTAGTRLVSRGRTSSTVRTHRPRDQRRAVRLMSPSKKLRPSPRRPETTRRQDPHRDCRPERTGSVTQARPHIRPAKPEISTCRARALGDQGQRHGEKAHRYLDISGAPSSPAARATVNRTKTPTVCRKQRPAVTTYGEFGSVPEDLAERAWIVLTGAFGLPREPAAACADARCAPRMPRCRPRTCAARGPAEVRGRYRGNPGRDGHRTRSRRAHMHRCSPLPADLPRCRRAGVAGRLSTPARADHAPARVPPSAGIWAPTA